MAEIGKNYHPWAITLKEALNIWLENHKAEYPNFVDFSRATKIQTSIFWSIKFGRRIVTTTNAYAEIYYLTKIPESDPRTIPKDQYGNSRAWSEEKWQEWLLQKNQQPIHLQSPSIDAKQIITQEAGVPDKRLTTTPGGLFGGMIDQLMLSLIEQVISNPEVIRTIREIIRQENRMAAQSPDIGMLAQTLMDFLSEIAEGEEEQKVQLQKKYGNLLSKLSSLMGILSDPNPKRREEKLLISKIKT